MNRPETKVYRQELLPTHFLERAGDAYADHIAVVDGEVGYAGREANLAESHNVVRIRSKRLVGRATFPYSRPATSRTYFQEVCDWVYKKRQQAR